MLGSVRGSHPEDLVSDLPNELLGIFFSPEAVYMLTRTVSTHVVGD